MQKVSNNFTGKNLAGKKIAILATNGFEESELLEPKKALEQAGAQVEVLSPKSGTIKSWKEKNWGREIPVTKKIADADPSQYDALMLPGGVINADTIRADKDAVSFVSKMVKDEKPLAAICHGAWALIETGSAKGHTMTSWPSLKSDLENAGARWVDREVVTDNGWVTSRKPADIPAFNAKMIEEFAEGRHSPKI